MARHLELVVLLLDLLLLRLFLVLVVHVVSVGTADQVVSVPFFVACSDLALLIVVIDEDGLERDVKLSLLDLIGRGQVRVQLELLSHLIDDDFLAVVVLTELVRLIIRGVADWQEGHTAVNQLVGPVLVLLDDLILLVEEFFAKDESVLLPVVEEVQLAVLAVDADHLLPVVVEQGAFVVLNQLELVWEASTHHQFVLAARVDAANLLRD